MEIKVGAVRPAGERTWAWRAQLAAHRAWLLAGALFALALAPRLLLAWRNQFDGLYGQDAYAYFGYARQMYQSLLAAHPPPQFWWPLGYPALLNVGFLLFGVSPRGAQLITLLAGAAVAPLAFALAREAAHGKYADTAGLVAGILAALGGQAVQSSVVVMADAPGLLWATLSAWLLLRYRRTRSGPTLLFSAAALGLAVITRWENLGLAMAWAAALAAGEFHAARGETAAGRSAARMLLPAFLVFALVLLPQLVYKFAFSAPLAGQSWLEGWSPLNFLARSFDNVDGHFQYALPVAAFYAQVFLHPAYLFPLFTPFLLAGAWVVARRFREDPTAAWLLLGWTGVMYLFLAGIPYENFRFGLGLFAPVCALAGIGAARAREQLGEVRGSAAGVLQTAFAALLVLACVGTVAWEPRVLQPVLAQKQKEQQQLRWLEARLPADATLFTFGLNGALQTYTALRVSDFSEESPQTVWRDLGGLADAYVFVDVTNVATQWQGHTVQQAFATLDASGRLLETGQVDGWSLFRVEGSP